jgi:lantibiotic biosynthesis protein
MKSDSVLFPYLLSRVVAEPYRDFTKMNLGRTHSILTKLQQLHTKQDDLKTKLSEELYQHIAITSEKKQRNVLIQMRRDIHNNRSLENFTSVIKILPLSYKKSVRSYQKNLFLEKKLQTEGEYAYKKDVLRAKKVFHRLLKKTNFVKGILLSSDTLPESLDKYTTTSNDSQTITKLERSLMEYLSRLYTKPSPFSTFTHVGVGVFGQKKKPLIQSDSVTLQSHIELNHYLFNYLRGLLVQNQELRKFLTIRLNFTIQQIDGHFVLLTNNNNQESFQSIATSPALDIIYQTIQSKDTWIYHDLVKKIVSSSVIDAAQTDIEAYLDNLLDYGFIEYDLGISGLDRDWDKQFIEKLIPLTKQFPYLKNLSHTLKKLRVFVIKYKNASAKKRQAILSEAFTLLKKTAYQLHLAAELPETAFEIPDSEKGKNVKETQIFKHSYSKHFYFTPHKIWYEDTFLDKKLRLSPIIKQQLETLGDFLSRMEVFGNCFEERYHAAQFFIDRYGKEAQVPLIQFYQEYVRKVKKTSDKKMFIKNNPIIKKRNQEKEKMLTAVISRMKKRLTDTDQIHLLRSDMQNIPASTSSHRFRTAFGAFFQITQDRDPLIVINDTPNGYGNLMSRFLYAFDNKVTNTLRSWNDSVGENVLLAEATDASLYNVDIHPRLFPYEIHMPGGQHRLTQDRWLSVLDIEVSYNDVTRRLMLFDTKRKKEVVVFNMGFQDIKTRADSYEFLCQFFPGNHHHFVQLTDRINKKAKIPFIKEKIRFLPRIVYEDTIILQRKTWICPKDFLPKRDPQESDWSYLFKVHRWKSELQIPDEVFVKQGYGKPQYISFHNPFLVALLEKYITREKEDLTIQEMLPNGDQIVPLNDKQQVSEFLAQWYI